MARPPQIGEYTPQVPVEEGLRRVIPEERGISAGPEVAELGGAINKVAVSEAANYTMNALSQAQGQWTEHLRSAAEQAPPGAPGFTPGFMKQYGDYVQQTLKAAPNVLARKMLAQHLTSFGNELQTRSLAFEAAAREKHNQDSGELAIQTAGNDLIDNPEKFADHLTTNASLINALNLNPQEKDALLIRNKTELARFATQGQIARDPYGAQVELLHPQRAYTAMLTPELREQMLGKADEAIRSRYLASEQADRMLKEQDARQQDALIKQGLELNVRGALTPAWVIQHSALLTHEQENFLLDKARGGREAVGDPHVFADLAVRARNGEDIEDDAKAALFRHDITESQFTAALNSSQKNLPSPYKQGFDYIDRALAPDMLNPDPGKAADRANALLEWDNWYQKNRGADADVAQAAFTSIARRYQLLDSNKQQLTIAPQLHYLVGPRTAPDMKATEAATVSAFKQGDLSKQELAQQLALIDQYNALTAAPTAKTDQKAKP